MTTASGTVTITDQPGQGGLEPTVTCCTVHGGACKPNWAKQSTTTALFAAAVLASATVRVHSHCVLAVPHLYTVYQVTWYLPVAVQLQNSGSPYSVFVHSHNAWYCSKTDTAYSHPHQCRLPPLVIWNLLVYESVHM